jgi:hypothetical protein
MGVSFGASEVTMPAFAEVHATRAAGGIPLAALAVGSLLGGLGMVALPPTDALRRRLLLTLVFFAVATAPLLAAGSLAAMTALALVAGLPVAPTFASTYWLINRLAARGAATESFAWITTAVVAGASLGTVAGGSAIARMGTDASLLLAAASASAAFVVAVARRATL